MHMKTLMTTVQKVLVARCERGEDLYAALARLVTEQGVRSGMLQVIGALSRGRLGVFEHGAYEWISHEGALEIASCSGNVAVKAGKPFVHCHAVLTDHRGVILGGHVAEGCIVDPTAEIHLTVLEGEIARRLDPASGLWVLDI